MRDPPATLLPREPGRPALKGSTLKAKARSGRSQARSPVAALPWDLGRRGSRGSPGLTGTSWLLHENWLSIGSPPPETFFDLWRPGAEPQVWSPWHPCQVMIVGLYVHPCATVNFRGQALELFPLNPSCLVHQDYWNDWDNEWMKGSPLPHAQRWETLTPGTFPRHLGKTEPPWALKLTNLASSRDSLTYKQILP